MLAANSRKIFATSVNTAVSAGLLIIKFPRPSKKSENSFLSCEIPPANVLILLAADPPNRSKTKSKAAPDFKASSLRLLKPGTILPSRPGMPFKVPPSCSTALFRSVPVAALNSIAARVNCCACVAVFA